MFRNICCLIHGTCTDALIPNAGEANIYIGLMSTLYVDMELSCGKIS
jgi:hypothetical protein